MTLFERRNLNTRFAQNFNKLLVLSWATAAIFFVLSIVTFDYSKLIGGVMAGLFSLCIASFLGYAYYRTHFVRCPQCHGSTKTYDDTSKERWIARCDTCSIDWDTGIGSGSTDD